MNIEKIRSIIEALILSAGEPVSIDRISQAVEEVARDDIKALMESLVNEWRSLGRGFHLVEVAGGWQFRTKAEHGAWLQRLHHDRPTKLSRASLETLSVIAYKQPITRPEVEDLRGVDSGAVLKNLLERNLIKIIGKKDAPGKPVVYGTTQRFLEVFSLRDLGSLPSLRDLKELEDEAGEQLAFPAVGGEDEIERAEPQVLSDSERRRKIRDSVRGLLSVPLEGEEGIVGGLPPLDEEDDNVLEELEQALKRRKEAAERAETLLDESEKEYVEKVTTPLVPAEPAAEETPPAEAPEPEKA